MIKRCCCFYELILCVLAMQQVSNKKDLKPLFLRFWSSQNVSNNCCEKIREVFRLCEKFRYFFFSFEIIGIIRIMKQWFCSIKSSFKIKKFTYPLFNLINTCYK